MDRFINKIIHGDCLEVMKDIPDGSIDLIVTDPPYGICFKSNHRKEKYNPILNDDTFDWLENFVDLCYKKLKNDTHLYCFCSWHHIDKFKVAIQKKFTLKNIIIWEKKQHWYG